VNFKYQEKTHKFKISWKSEIGILKMLKSFLCYIKDICWHFCKIYTSRRGHNANRISKTSL